MNFIQNFCIFLAFSLFLKAETLQNEKLDFAELALKNSLNQSLGLNILDISTYEYNYFSPLSYTFKGKYPQHKRSEAQFQISVKKPLFENILNLNEKYYFAYTQRAWWQLYASSAPLRELNYKPEFFISFLQPFQYEALKNINFGFLHESNGRAFQESRSWNRLYINALFVYQRFFITPRLWYRLKEQKDDNKDISLYLGNFDLNVQYLGKDYFISALIRNTMNFKHNKAAFELSTGFDFFDNGVFWYVQYFNGYGQSLIEYNRYTNRLSFGFLIAY